MNRPLILSDRLAEASDESRGSFFRRVIQAASPTAPQHAGSRGSLARNAEDFIPSLWPTQLPLRKWPRSWAEALSLHQPAKWSASPVLRTQHRRRTCSAIDRHAKQAARDPRSNLRSQHRAFAATRGSRIDNESLARPDRFSQGGCNTGRYGDRLSRRLTAACCGGGQ